MSLIKNKLYGLLKGSFLVSEDAFRNWRFIIFVVVWLLVVITSSHKVDEKVMHIAALQAEIKELRAAFVDTRAVSVKMRLESTVKNSVEVLGLKPAKTPPQIIHIVNQHERH
ncbi:MAG: FtsL-like putative cell division protein [Lutibacter sp.]|jgi:hypothetical protein|nr:FtsL-like putative cell division protein [Lutibacter sp.]